MDDLISRSALLAEYDRVHIGPPGGARKLIENAPAVDAVEVVKCKDCKHRFYSVDDEMYCCAAWSYGFDGVREEDFCSRGERKEND